ncbi:MAG: T9SS C-terminal target domain-containing protein, partial [Gemmatimonadetes bacterium]
TISLTHSYDADLDIYLISPAGTRVELSTDNGGSGNDYLSTEFDDEASTPITSGSPPFTGTFRPEGALSALDGESITGDWTLEITDQYNLDGGTLTIFALDLRYIDPQPGTALDFDGIDDVVTVADNNVLDLSSSGTLEAWIYPTVTNNYGGIIHKGDQPDFSDEAYTLQLWNDDRVAFAIVNSGGTSQTLFSTSTLTANQWYHVAATWDASGMSIYLNGTLDASNSTAITARNSAGGLNIGAQLNDASYPFSGQIEEVRLFNTARTQSEIRENMHLTLGGFETGLVSYWQLNDASGSTARDVKNAQDGTLNNMNNVDWVTSTVATGGGTSNTQTPPTGASAITFTGTGIVANFTANSAADPIVATRINLMPYAPPTGQDTVFGSQYWVINRFGSGTFSANMDFTLADDLNAVDAANPNRIQLFARGNREFGTWTLVANATAVNELTETVTFNGITQFDRQFVITRSTDMYYASSTTTQNSNNVLQNSLDQQIIGIEIVMDGTTNPLSVTQFDLNTTGTTNTADIANAKIYYTGTSSTFSTTNQFGSTIAAPNGSFTITGSQALSDGTNYFWLTYDVTAGATIGNQIDAQCTAFELNGTRTPTVTAPAGARTIVGTPDDFPGYALDFDGVDDNVQIPDDNSLDLTSTYTVEAWINPVSWGENNRGRIVDKNVYRFMLRNNGNLWWRSTTGGSVRTSFNNVINWNQWQHVAVICDGSSVEFYVNGVLSSSGQSALTLSASTSNLYIGNNGGTNSTFEGKIDEVRIWNTARSVQDLRENMHLTLVGTEPGLVSYWQFNEGTGSTTSDPISGNDGTLNNMDAADWVASTVATGAGASATAQPATGASTTTFTGTGVSMRFTTNTASDPIVVTRIDRTPNLVPSGTFTVYDSQYWVIHRYGSGTFDTDLILTVAEDLTSLEAAYPERLSLYRRDATSDGAWTLVGTGTEVNAATDEVTFSGITTFGQFLVVRDIYNVNICGNVTADSSWVADTVRISCDVTVLDGVTLTIGAGTYVEFQDHYKLNVQGRLLASGTATDSITFTVPVAQQSTGWHGIRFDQTPATNDTSRIQYCKFEYGHATDGNPNYPDTEDDHGGALFVKGFSKLIVEYSRFVNNQAEFGGAIMLRDTSNIVIRNCTISNNQATSSLPFFGSMGGGIFCYRSSPILSYNTIVNNSADWHGGGVVCHSGSNATITNNTIGYNVANAFYGGGLACFFDSDPVLTNTILWGNTSAALDSNEAYIAEFDSDPLFINCNVQGGIFDPEGRRIKSNRATLRGGHLRHADNIDADPMFVRPPAGAGVDYNGLAADWSLVAESPCIDAGFEGDVPPPGGEPRVDMGSYEFVPDRSQSVQGLGTSLDENFIRGTGSAIAATAGTIDANVELVLEDPPLPEYLPHVARFWRVEIDQHLRISPCAYLRFYYPRNASAAFEGAPTIYHRHGKIWYPLPTSTEQTVGQSHYVQTLQPVCSFSEFTVADQPPMFDIRVDTEPLLDHPSSGQVEHCLAVEVDQQGIIYETTITDPVVDVNYYVSPDSIVNVTDMVTVSAPATMDGLSTICLMYDLNDPRLPETDYVTLRGEFQIAGLNLSPQTVDFRIFVLDAENEFQIADFNGDGCVESTDLLTLLYAYGSQPADDNWNSQVDIGVAGVYDVIGRDAQVGFADLLRFASYYGMCDNAPLVWHMAPEMMPAKHAGTTKSALPHLNLQPQRVSPNRMSVDLDVAAVTDLYGASLNLHYPAEQLRVVQVTEGDFLQAEGVPTFFYQQAENGVIQIDVARLGNVSGKPGTGTLARVTFDVLRGGEWSLEVQAVNAVNADFQSLNLQSYRLQGNAGEPLKPAIPQQYGLAQNYPNPFNPVTTIRYQLPQNDVVTLHVYDIAGRLVRRLLEREVQEAGYYRLQWDGTDDRHRPLSSGMYIYRLETPQFQSTKTMMLLR